MLVRSGAFLQSKGWEAFQRSLGKEIKRIKLEKEGERESVLMVGQEVGLGIHYWYCGRGELAEKIKKENVGEMGGAAFVRWDSPALVSPSFSLSPAFPHSAAPHDVQPRTTIIIDLTKTSDDLLKEMHPKTRYNIKVAEKRGVAVEQVGSEGFEEFWTLLEATTERDAFRSHAKSYYQKMLEDHGDAELKIFLAIARVDGRPAAAALMLDYAGTRTYLHGASDYTLRDAMAPYALHWQLMQDAKTKGLKAYDLWGIAPTDDPSEPLAGVTRFKKGWGGEVLRYPATQDLILRPWKYKLYRFLRRTRP